ncbi:MAG TPA: oligosaccharide flippase family protein [Acidobacteriaceae bacterium]
MHLSIGQGLRLLIQAAYFVLIARSLGPAAYGAFAAVVALAAVLGPFSGMGTTNLFIRDVRSGKREAVICWGNGLLITVVSGSLLTVLVLVLNHFLHLKTSSFIVLVVCISDLIFMKITELAAFGFAASNRMKDTSIQSVVISLLRLLAIGILVLALHHVSLSEWVWAYLVSGMVGTGYAVYRGTALWGSPQLQLSSLREDLSEGLFFSISTSATSIYNDVDKIMLGRLSDFASTGIYSAAYRLIDVSMTPVRSLVSAAYPVFFKKGVGGIRATYPYAKSLIFKASMYGAAISIGLWICAPILPLLLGKQYILAVPALRLLSLIPLLRCFHVFLADSLSGAGFQRTRTVIQVGVGLLNVIANLLILPRFSWRGAAWTSLACDGLLVVIFWAVSDYLYRRQTPQIGEVMPA